MLDSKPAKEVKVFWRPLGGGEFSAVTGRHVTQGVWTAELPRAASETAAFEYYVAGLTEGGQGLNFPVGAPRATQTVVVMPAME